MEIKQATSKIESQDGVIFQITTGAVDRHGEVVDPNGLKTIPKSIPMYFNHETTRLPLGKWVNIERNSKGWQAEAVFDLEDEYALQIRNKVKNGFIESASIGFIGQNATTVNDVFTFTEWDLIETSFAPIPANKEAVRIKSLETEEGKAALKAFDTWLKAGAVLSKENKEKLQIAVENTQSVIENAERDKAVLVEEIKAEAKEAIQKEMQDYFKELAKDAVAEAHEAKALKQELQKIYSKYGV